MDEDLRQFLPEFDYLLTDTNQLSDKALLNLQAGLLINTLLLSKHGGDKEYLIRNIRLLFRSPGRNIADSSEKNYFQTLFVYYFKVANIVQNEEKTVKKMLQQLDQPIREEGMTIYEWLIEQGIEHANKAHIRRLLNKGFSSEKIIELLGVPAETIEAVRKETEL